MKRNYQIEMEHEVQKIRAAGRRPKLVLHACCAPCSSAVLEMLNQDFELIIFDYNPNISPEKEFRMRLEELQRLVKEMPLAPDVRVIEARYDPGRFYSMIRGHEDDPEGGERCGICFEMRLRETCRYAKQIGADYFSTTLSISPLKNAERLNTIGARLAEEYGVSYLFSDFKKKNGYRRSCILSEEYKLYRQDYCGCVFSREERHNILSKEAIIRNLRTRDVGRELELYDVIDSTNNRARALAREGAPHGTTVVADAQTEGRGRFARVFWSPEHSGVYLSIVLRLQVPADRAVQVTAMTAVAVARAVEKMTGIDAKIKWVNDIYLNNKKVCGILCESELDLRNGQLKYIVVGIGVNISRMEFPEELKDRASSLENESGKHVSRSRFTAELLNQMEELCAGITEGGFMEEYRARSNVIGRSVNVIRGDEEYTAKVVSIDQDGSLITEKENGAREVLHSGEISIRL